MSSLKYLFLDPNSNIENKRVPVGDVVALFKP